MSASNGAMRRMPSPTSLVAGALMILGLVLTSVSWWFLLLTAAGVVGPGVLRELGLLDDKDEFQRRAIHRAGYHAFLVCTFAAFLLVAFFRSGERSVGDLQEIPTLFVALSCFSWLVSSLIDYWGARTGARRILLGFGLAWLAFMVLSNTGREWTGPTALLMQSLLALPFFALSWSAGRWPRATGLLSLALSAALFEFLGFASRSPAGLMTTAVTVVLFLGPLIGSGVALLAIRPGGDAEPDA